MPFLNVRPYITHHLRFPTTKAMAARMVPPRKINTIKKPCQSILTHPAVTQPYLLREIRRLIAWRMMTPSASYYSPVLCQYLNLK